PSGARGVAQPGLHAGAYDGPQRSVAGFHGLKSPPKGGVMQISVAPPRSGKARTLWSVPLVVRTTNCESRARTRILPPAAPAVLSIPEDPLALSFFAVPDDGR